VSFNLGEIEVINENGFNVTSGKQVKTTKTESEITLNKHV
jgi:hypothetical protein